MSIEKIAEADLTGRGVTALPDNPAISSSDLKRKFEEILRDIVIPKLNETIDGTNELDERTADLDVQRFAELVTPVIKELLIETAGFITAETDPTVPAWAKSDGKPTYTPGEVGAQPAIAATVFDDEASITLPNGESEYRASGAISTLSITYPSSGSFDAWIRFTTAANGTITVTLPASPIFIGSVPTFGNGEMWELSIKDSVIIAAKAA